MSFFNKVVIITGASAGIGAATAISFAKEGANVVIVGRNETNLQKVREECAQTGNEPLLIKADICNEEDTIRIINETIEKFNKIDILVNNAGITAFGGVLSDNVMAQYDHVMNTNLRGPVHITSLAAPHVIKTKGNIINISSIAGKTTFPRNLATFYAISKAALDHFTRNLAAELARYGVRVNTVSPGPVRTDILITAGVEMSMEAMKHNAALGRISDVTEIADLILFIASDKAIAITGSDYISDNGMLLKYCNEKAQL